MSAAYPWLAPAWDDLSRRHAAGRLGHAFLVAGRSGLGKRALAQAFAERVLCEGADGAPAGSSACGRCRSCLLIASGNHPDLKRVAPEEERKSIGIEQVRELLAFFALTSHYGRHKVVLIEPAEAMTTAAANALLKMLEEPPGNALLVLVSHRPGQLLPTILSRCQKVTIRTPDWTTCRAWLAACRRDNPALPDPDAQTLAGAPLAILARLEAGEASLHDCLLETLAAIGDGTLDVIAGARRHAGCDARELVDALELVVGALIEVASGLSPRFVHLAPAAARSLQDLANQLNSGPLFRYLDQLGEARGMLLRSSGVRGAEVFENLLFHWSRIARTETTA
ncbi:MAG: DNA polymerase III subunit delta' [Gammaproteobacteria bacterium]